MTGPRINSRRAQVRRADALLRALLRTPKTRAGLIAAVTGKKISRHFVYGWLSQQLTTGEVAVLKSVHPTTYQLNVAILQEQAAPGVFPTWLEPRALPLSRARHVYISGRSIAEAVPEEEDDDETDL